MAKRLKAMGSVKYQLDGDPRTSGPGFGTAVHPDTLDQPLGWRKPRKVFVNSMSDIGHARFSPAVVARIWAVMALTARHEYQILSKRPRRIANLLSDADFVTEVAREAAALINQDSSHLARRGLDLGEKLLAGDSEAGWGSGAAGDDISWSPSWPLTNVWVGTSIESDEYCWRAEHLRRAPASVRFLSLEPLLGPLPNLDLTDIHWVIVGGESGRHHRKLDLSWVRDIRDRCVDRGVPFFFKQRGGSTPKAGGRILDGRTWDEYPIRHRAGVEEVPM